MDEHDGALDVIETENKGTATSASLYRMQNIMDSQDAVQVGSSICFSLLIYIKSHVALSQGTFIALKNDVL